MEGAIHAIGYPVFGLDWVCHEPTGKKIIAIAGGGGSSKSGIQNRVTLVEVDETKTEKASVKEEALILDSKEDLITNIALHPQGTYLVCGIGPKAFIYAIDAKCSKFSLLHSFVTDFAKSNPFQNVVCFNHTGDQIATGGEDGIVRVWKLPPNPTKISETWSLNGHTDYINAIDYDITDRMMVSSAKDGKCNVWNLKTGKKICELPNPSSFLPPPAKRAKRVGKYIYRCTKFALTADDEQFLVAILTPPRGASFVTKWSAPDPTDSETSSELIEMKDLGGHSSACALATQPGYVAVGGSDGSVSLFDGNSLDKIRIVHAHHLPVTGISFKPDSGSDDAPVELMSASADYSLYLLRGHGSSKIKILTRVILVLFFVLGVIGLVYFQPGFLFLNPQSR